MNKVEQASQYIDLIRVKSNEALLFLSLGKDSLVLLDLVYPKFDRIVCVFMYFVKNLEHINRWINWTKAKYPKIEFVQVPHWNLTYILRGGMYCAKSESKAVEVGRCGKGYATYSWSLLYILGHEKS